MTKHLISHRIFLNLVAIVLFTMTSGAAAQTSLSGLIINAEESDYDLKNKRVTLTGNVQIVWNGNHLSAAKADIDMENKVINATGDVVIQNSKLHAEAQKIEYNYDTETGLFFDSFIQSGQVVFEGKMIEKTGERNFIATKAKYTTCETCPGAWSFSGKTIEAEMGGYAWISRPILRVAGLPILILPGIVVPLKSERQSGFLVPSYNFTNRGGSAIAQSYFWAISRNKDLTLTARNFEKRGLMSEVEYRYVLTEKSNGRFQGAHILDQGRIFSQGKVIDRWFATYSHVFDLPDNLVHRASFTGVSDLRYPIDFPQQLDSAQDSAIENSMSLTKIWDSQFASIEGTYNINLLKTDPLASNDESVHRLPEIHYNIKNQRLFDSSLLGKFDLNYVNFTRNGPSYDDLSVGDDGSFSVAEKRDGNFQPLDTTADPINGSSADLIRTGHRLDLNPSISLPFQISKVIDILPKVSYRETQYRFQIDEDIISSDNYSKSASRRYLQTDISARTQFSRVYGDLKNSNSARFKHEIEPQVSFSNIPWIRRADHGFFGNFANQTFSQSQEPITDADYFGSDGTRNKIQFDYNDRVFDRRVASYALINRIVRKTWKYGQPAYENALVASIEQSYDLNEASAGAGSEPWLPINSLIEMNFDNFETVTLARYYPYAQRTNINARVRVKNSYGDFFQLIYNQFIRIREDNTLISNTETENIGAGLGLTSRFLNLYGELNYSNISFQILNWRYGIVIKPPGECVQLMFAGTVVPNGDPQFDANITFNFGGDQ